MADVIDTAPPAEGTAGLSPIAQASAALRAQVPVVPAAPSVPAEAPAASEPAAPASGEQPRNADGTFAPKAPTEGEAPVGDAPAEGEGSAEGETPAPEAVAEPKVFTLKGEAQRGEPDIELDITGLPPEVVERLERNEKQGMRRKEYDQSMRKVRTERADLDAVEAEISVDPDGFVLNRIPPVRRQSLAETLLVEQFEALAPMIEKLWNDPELRFAKLNAIREAVEGRRTDVISTVQTARHAAEVRAAAAELIPENVPEQDAQEFFVSAITLLQQAAVRGERVAPDTVPALLASHRRRFFGAADAAPPAAPARPKIAVASTPTKAKPATASPSPSITAEQVAAQARARQAAAAVAPVGAGAGAVQRPGPTANETIEQASRRLRGLPPK